MSILEITAGAMETDGPIREESLRTKPGSIRKEEEIQAMEKEKRRRKRIRTDQSL